MEIYEDGENWCHREIFNEDGTLVEDNFECPDECYKCGCWSHLNVRLEDRVCQD